MVEVRLVAAAGEYMDSATVVRWLKEEGQPVEQGEALVLVETAKASVELPAPASGVLRRILCRAGEEVPVGTILGYIEAVLSPVSSPEPDASRATVEAPTPEEDSLRVRASPRARALARSLGVSLDRLRGTGPGGRIVERDLLQTAPGTGPSGSHLEELTGYRPAAAAHLARAAAVPQFSVCLELDATPLRRWQREFKEWAARHDQRSPSITAAIIKAAAMALRRCPRVNSCWEDGRLRIFDEVNVGVAVSTRHGLVVPVIHGADRLSVGAIAIRIQELRQLAEAQRLSPHTLQGGTFTVSNLGMMGVTRFVPLVNPPQAAILGVSAIRDEAAPWAGSQAGPAADPRQVVELTLVADHRALDGADAAAFLCLVKDILEHPAVLAW